MIKEVKLFSPDHSDYENALIELASACPLCGKVLIPHIVFGSYTNDIDDKDCVVYLLNYCNACNEEFLSRHEYGGDSEVFIFVSSAPIHSVSEHFTEHIKTLSPEFVSIYNEALHAENLGLSSICGMGYRKALEFLVKDYAISKHPADKESIKKMNLSACIEKYMPDKKTQTLAKASTWLGNDETHYCKKHTTYNISGLKAFIRFLVFSLDSEFSFQDAEKLLNSK